MAQTETKEKSTLTMKIDRRLLAELKAAATIFGATSYSSLVHQLIVHKIREAKEMVSRDDFERIRGEQAEKISIRSKTKTEERKKIDAKILVGEEVLEDFQVNEKPKKKTVKKKSNSITTKDGETFRYLEEDEGFNEK